MTHVAAHEGWAGLGQCPIAFPLPLPWCRWCWCCCCCESLAIDAPAVLRTAPLAPCPALSCLAQDELHLICVALPIPYPVGGKCVGGVGMWCPVVRIHATSRGLGGWRPWWWPCHAHN